MPWVTSTAEAWCIAARIQVLFSNVSFESTGFSAGRITKNGSSIVPTYHVNDYLCSVRVVTDASGEVLERNDYSGFGKRLASSTGSSNRYRFIGKEEQRMSFAGCLDFGARMYDPEIARWTTPDPLAFQYPGISPYAYCANDPVNFVDPEGMDIWHINRNGVITWEEKSEDHRLYSLDNYGNRSENYVTVNDRKILDVFTDKTGTTSYTTGSNIDDVYKVFLLAANNSEVEWVVHRGQNDMYTIGTLHDEDSAGSWSDYGIDKPVASVHSHPEISQDVTNELFSMSHDWANARQDSRINGIHARQSYVYFPESSRLYYVESGGVRYIRSVDGNFRNFYFGVLNHR